MPRPGREVAAALMAHALRFVLFAGAAVVAYLLLGMLDHPAHADPGQPLPAPGAAVAATTPATPDIPAPGIPAPDIAAPDIPAPDIPAPDIPAPDIPAPAVSTPVAVLDGAARGNESPSSPIPVPVNAPPAAQLIPPVDRKSTRLNSSHSQISY